MGFFDTILGGGTKSSPVFSSKKLQAGIDSSVASANRFQNRRNSILDVYGNLSENYMAQAQKMLPDSIGDVSLASQKARSIDPMETYRTVRDENLAALGRQADMMSGVGKREESIAAARLGMAGRPTSMARDVLRSNRANAALAPTVNSIFSNVGRDSSGINADQASTVELLMQLASARPDVFNSYLNMALNPMRAEADGLNAEGSFWQQLANAAKTNTAGVNVESSGGIMDIISGLTSAAGDVVGGITGWNRRNDPAPSNGVDMKTLAALVAALSGRQN